MAGRCPQEYHTKAVNTRKKPADAIRQPSTVQVVPGCGSTLIVSGALRGTDTAHNRSDPNMTRYLFPAKRPRARGTDRTRAMRISKKSDEGCQPKSANPE